MRIALAGTSEPRRYEQRIGYERLDGKTEFHIHFNSVRPYCAKYLAGEVFEIGQMFPVNGMGHEFMVSLGGDERSMFIGVGNVSK